MLPVLVLVGLVSIYYLLYHTNIGKSFIEFVIEMLNEF